MIYASQSVLVDASQTSLPSLAYLAGDTPAVALHADASHQRMQVHSLAVRDADVDILIVANVRAAALNVVSCQKLSSSPSTDLPRVVAADAPTFMRLDWRAALLVFEIAPIFGSTSWPVSGRNYLWGLALVFGSLDGVCS